MPARTGLLVSVRSAAEALCAVEGGASVVDVKEPDRGALGMADPEVWREVRQIVPRHLPVTVALGDLEDWRDRAGPEPSRFEGLAFRKMGFAHAGADWADRWTALRTAWGDGPAWVAVVYADFARAGAPSPGEVIAEAARARCAGVLIDTYGKEPGVAIDRGWAEVVAEIRLRVGLVVIAGGLDEAAIRDLRDLDPDHFAVRGAACERGDRRLGIDPGRVGALVRACSGGV